MRVPLVVLIDGISPGAGDIVLKIFLLLFSFQHTPYRQNYKRPCRNISVKWHRRHGTVSAMWVGGLSSLSCQSE